jgi:predicted nucleic acid-binding protein
LKPSSLTKCYIDSCIFIDYLNKSGPAEKRQAALNFLKEAEEGKIITMTSAFTMAEVLKVDEDELSGEEQEIIIQQLFAQPWLNIIEYERKVAEISRHIARTHQIKPGDSIHIATAIRSDADYLITTDDKLIKRCSKFSDFPMKLRQPFFSRQGDLLS